MPQRQAYLRSLGYTSTFQLGRTVCAVDVAHTVRVHIDAEEYFNSLMTILEKAEHSIYILGWDIDSRTYLKKDKDGNSSQEYQIFYFIQKLIRNKPNLNIYLLCWNYSLLFTLERELWPLFKPQAWGERVHFVLDKFHPLLSSHHQKMVVVDDTWGFVGGIDLCENRLDNSSHRLETKYRTNVLGKPYRPWHDMQCCVTGPVVKKLGLLARERWFLATKKRIDPPPEPEWNEKTRELPYPPQFQDFSLGICRTQPKHRKQRRARENYAILLEMIRRSKKFILIENQYLTARAIRKALERSLAQPEGPEIIIILPKFPFGWLENLTIAVLQTRVLRKLREKDKHGRFRAFYPQLSHDEESYLYVHSKFILVDDLYMKIGSSNINNRSMGLDTEMDLAFEAQDEKSHMAIRQIRYRLFAEHLNQTEEWVAEQDSKMKLLEMIETQRKKPRCLQHLRPTTMEWLDYIIPHIPFFDSPHPIHWSRLVFYMYYRTIDLLRQVRRRP